MQYRAAAILFEWASHSMASNVTLLWSVVLFHATSLYFSFLAPDPLCCLLQNYCPEPFLALAQKMVFSRCCLSCALATFCGQSAPTACSGAQSLASYFTVLREGLLDFHLCTPRNLKHTIRSESSPMVTYYIIWYYSILHPFVFLLLFPKHVGSQESFSHTEHPE